MEREWQWELCLGCGPFIRCPTCGGGCFPSGMPDGSECPTCPEVRAAWIKAREEGTVPDLPEFRPEAVAQARAEAHQRAIDAGMVFPTMDEVMAAIDQSIADLNKETPDAHG